MAYNGFAIDEYLDAAEVTRQLDELKKSPVYSINRDALQGYVDNYFEKKCRKSKELIGEAKEIIPGGVQHNLAFNYPFPIVIDKASGAKLYDRDGNWYYDLLQAGGPTILGSNPESVRAQVIDLLNTCGPSTGLFHEFEYKLAKKISDCVPSVEMFRMLGSGTEACMVAARIARLKTGKKNILKMGGAYHGWSDQLAYGIRIPGTKGIQSRGVPNFVFKHTDEFFPNDLEDLERKLRKHRLDGGTAAVFLEPVGPESGTRPVSKEFVKGVEELAHKYGFIYAAVGVHPSEVEELNDEAMDRLKAWSADERCVAIGEIGLDYHWPDPAPEIQKKWFVRQLDLAREVKLPVVIHSRDAAKDTMDIMHSEHAEDIGGVVHCFSYSKEIAKECVDMGFYIGVGGVVTFKNGKKLREVVDRIPMEKILLETDCPYLSPEPHRGERNSSLNLPYVVKEIANIKGISEEDVIRITEENAKRMYGLMTEV